MVAENPSVPQPGFEPDVMSFKPGRQSPYSRGLRKPSGGSPFEMRLSVSSEIMPATVCALAVSWVLGWMAAEGGKKERRTGAEALVPPVVSYCPFRTVTNLSACAEMSGTPRPRGLHKLQST